MGPPLALLLLLLLLLLLPRAPPAAPAPRARQLPGLLGEWGSGSGSRWGRGSRATEGSGGGAPEWGRGVLGARRRCGGRLGNEGRGGGGEGRAGFAGPPVLPLSLRPPAGAGRWERALRGRPPRGRAACAAGRAGGRAGRLGGRGAFAPPASAPCGVLPAARGLLPLPALAVARTFSSRDGSGRARVGKRHGERPESPSCRRGLCHSAPGAVGRLPPAALIFVWRRPSSRRRARGFEAGINGAARLSANPGPGWWRGPRSAARRRLLLLVSLGFAVPRKGKLQRAVDRRSPQTPR